MTSKAATFALLLSPSSLLPGADSPSAPAVNWILPLFTDKDGHRSMTLRGTEVRPAGKNVAVTDLSITVFSGDAAARVESMLLSPQAVFYPKENRAAGDGLVRWISDEAEVTGTGWTYEHGEQVKKVSLRANVRIVFKTQLNDILK